MKKRTWFGILGACVLAGGIVSNQELENEQEPEVPTVSAAPAKETPEWWEGVVSKEVAGDVSAAMKEIGENPANIERIEYVDTRETDLFDRMDYKVTFRHDKLTKPGWVHSRFYRITTEEWHEGGEQYPREYLVTVKFWGETNVNQWTHNGK